MDDFTPTPEFEKKVGAAASAPCAGPKFVNQLRAQVIAAARKAETADQLPHRQNRPLMKLFTRKNKTMRTRFLFPALVAVIAIAVVAFFTLNTATKVSAQQILDRASAAQSAASSATARGICHIRIETEKNYQALGQDTPATKTTSDSYDDMTTGRFRFVITNAAGKITEAASRDGSYTYSTKEIGGDTLTIYRTPLSQQESGKLRLAQSDGSAETKALFVDFRSNPRVDLEGTITWLDGSQAYVLVDRNYETQKASNGQVEQVYTGAMKMVFNAQTYALLETERTIHKDGKDIVIDASRWLVNEVLPLDRGAAWDLSDLPGAKIVDEPFPTQIAQSSDSQSEIFSERELAARTKTAYVLKTIPAGWTLEIVAQKNQPKGQPYAYEVNYSNSSGMIFSMQAIGLTDEGFIKSNFYDGSYKSAAGLILNFGTSSNKEHTRAILTTPEGNSFLLWGDLPREQVQTLVEDLTPVR